MRRKQKGFSLIELLIVVAIILIIAAIAIPKLSRSRMVAEETSAVGSLSALNTACLAYQSIYGIGYPASLANLGPATAASSNSADLLDNVLVGGVKSGYSFTYVAGKPTGATISSYTINADPLVQDQTGVRHFYTDQSGTIRQSFGGPASASSSPIS